VARRLTKDDVDAARIGARVCGSISANNDAAACFRHLARGNERRALNASGPKRLVHALLDLATAAKAAADKRAR
jgi:hypothetical protein